MADRSFLVGQRLVQGLRIVLCQSLAIVLAVERGQGPSQRAFLQQWRQFGLFHCAQMVC